MDKEILGYLRESIDKINIKLDNIDKKLEGHVDKLARLEERQNSTKGALTIVISFIITAIGWLIYKAKGFG